MPVGIRMYHPAYLSGLHTLCDEFSVHFIADGIAGNFGRTGALFAGEQANIPPDFMCRPKGSTAAFMALSAVLTTDDVHQAPYAQYNADNAFFSLAQR